MGKLGKYLQGYVKIRLESPMPERFLSLCVHNQISLWNLKNTGLYYEMELSVKDYFQINSFRRKTQSRILLLEKHGLPFFFQKNKKRKAFFLGIILGIMLLYGCSLFIWDIQIYGNHYYTRETVLETLEAFHVKDGTRKKNIDCQDIAAHIRASFPQVVWVSAKIQGTCLIIQLKENEDSYSEDVSKEAMESWDLASEKDGTVVKIITRKGRPLVKAGQTCKAGDVLVSGRLEILDNDSQIQRYEYVKADADIKLLTEYSYYDEFSLQHQVKVYNEEEKRYGLLRFFDWEFSLWKNKENHADIYRTLHPVYLTSSFCLPVSYGSIHVVPYTVEKQYYTKKEAEAIAQKHFQVFLENLASQKIQIQNHQITTSVTSTKCISKGKLQVIQKAGKPVPVEKIQEKEEKTPQ